MAYKLILWDVDDTLLDFKKSEYSALHKAFKDYHLTLSDADYYTYSHINDDYWKQLELGRLTRNQICIMRFDDLKNLGILPSYIDSEKFNTAYFSHLKYEAPHIPHASYVIHSLYNKHYKMAVISNGVTHLQYTRLKKAKLFKYFDKIFVSQQIGSQKPSLDFIQAVYKAYPNINPSEMLIIGDSPSSDMKLATNAHIDCVWYNPHHKSTDLPITYNIDNLMSILDILKN